MERWNYESPWLPSTRGGQHTALEQKVFFKQEKLLSTPADVAPIVATNDKFVQLRYCTVQLHVFGKRQKKKSHSFPLFPCKSWFECRAWSSDLSLPESKPELFRTLILSAMMWSLLAASSLAGASARGSCEVWPPVSALWRGRSQSDFWHSARIVARRF